MSYELKMQGVGNGKRSRLYKKTKRASMNKIDAIHLPMRVQSDRGLVHIPYSKIRKFLMTRVGRPVDKVYSEFLQEGSKYAQIRFARRVNTFLGPNEVGTKHIEELWDLQYLPIRIKALPEGTLCPIKVPALTFINTHPDFFWLTNYFETLISTTLWLPMTSATSARLAKKELVRHAKKTGFSEEVNLNFLIHDFSMRGMAGVEAAIMSGMGHMTSFCGSETIPAIAALEEYYNADAEKELIAATIPATEHSVMCAGGTFVGIANKIREVNPDRKLAIYVTHMVNPKGITTLSENYDEVYFTNSYKDWDKSDLPDNVRIIKVI